MHSAQTQRRGGFLGSLQGFGILATLLLALATGFFTFFAATFAAIVALLAWNGLGHHAVNYADTYLYVGLPAGAIALVLALAVLFTQWLRGKLRS
jgi:hypothetical protein